MFILEMLLLIIVGFMAGVINTVSAGGSLITLPTLLFLGIPSAEANGTNRVAIVVQSLTSFFTFVRKGKVKLTGNANILIASTLGAIFGALSALTVSDDLFMIILAFTMIVTLGFIVWNPVKAINRPGSLTPLAYALGVAAFVLIGFYSGFIQVGVGFYIMIVAILLFRKSFVEATLLKIMVVGLSVSISLIIFAVNGQVLWEIGLVLAIGNALGAWVGSKMILLQRTGWIQFILVVTVLILAARLIYEAIV